MTGLILVGLIPFGALAILFGHLLTADCDRARDGRPRRRPGRARRRLVSDHERRALLHRSRAAVVLARPGEPRRRSAAADGGRPAGWSWRAGLSYSALWPSGPTAAIPRASRRESARTCRATTSSSRAGTTHGDRRTTPRKPSRCADAVAHERGVLADAAREDERVEAAERGRHRSDRGRDPVRVDVERERPSSSSRTSPEPARQACQAGLDARARGRARRRDSPRSRSR